MIIKFIFIVCLLFNILIYLLFFLWNNVVLFIFIFCFVGFKIGSIKFWFEIIFFCMLLIFVVLIIWVFLGGCLVSILIYCVGKFFGFVFCFKIVFVFFLEINRWIFFFILWFWMYIFNVFCKIFGFDSNFLEKMIICICGKNKVWLIFLVIICICLNILFFFVFILI